MRPGGPSPFDVVFTLIMGRGRRKGGRGPKSDSAPAMAGVPATSEVLKALKDVSKVVDAHAAWGAAPLAQMAQLLKCLGRLDDAQKSHQPTEPCDVSAAATGS